MDLIIYEILGEHVYIINRTNIKAIIIDMILGAYDTLATAIKWTFS